MRDLYSVNPRDWVREGSWSELTEAVSRLDSWDQRAAEVVDLIVRVWVLRGLREARRAADLDPLAEGLARLVDPMLEEGLNALDQPYGHHWQAFGRMVDDCRDGLDAESGAPVLQREHVGEVLAWLEERAANAEDRAVPQKELVAALGISKATASYVLGLMETTNLVARKVRGREKDVYALVRGDGTPMSLVPGAGPPASEASDASEIRHKMDADQRGSFASYLGQAG